MSEPDHEAEEHLTAIADGEVPLQWRYDGDVTADRVVVLAHGAGTDMYAPVLNVLMTKLTDAGIGVFRFNYRYKSLGRRAPDRPAVLWATTQSAVKVAADYTARDTGKLIVGGRSMGGRYMSMVAAGDEEHAPTPVAGLLLAGYPLYPPGKPDNVRDAHFAAITCPTLFIQGTRDPMGSVDALTAAATGISGTVAWCWLPDADHGFKPRKSSGRSQSDCFVMAGDAAATWVQSQPR